MSKLLRLIAVAMCCVLVLGLMVSCGETEMEKVENYLKENKPTPEEPYVTLNMYIPANFDATNDTVMQDIVNAMQNEFNQVIEEKYRTRVIFHFIKEDVYETELLAQRDYALSQKDTPLKIEQTSIQDKYPKEDKIQFDIFVATSEKLVKDYAAAGAIFTKTEAEGAISLTEVLNTTYLSKFCNENSQTSLPSIIYNNAVDNDVRYGVPANFLIGQYTYLAIDRAAADELFFEQITGTVSDRVNKLSANIDAANADITERGENKALYVKDEIIISNLTEADLAQYPENKYYHLVEQNPKLTTADIYKGMFCIASTCRYPGKALDVISELYNNKELHTTLQYGAEEVSYRYEEIEVEVDGKIEKKTVVVPIKTDDGQLKYDVNPRYTGNITNLYECKDDTLFSGILLTREYLDRVYKQNLEAEFSKV